MQSYLYYILKGTSSPVYPYFNLLMKVRHRFSNLTPLSFSPYLPLLLRLLFREMAAKIQINSAAL